MPAPPPAEQFWLLTGEVPIGPFTLSQVHAELAAGRATWGTRACRVGGSTWLPLLHTPGIGPSAPPRAATDTHAPEADQSSPPGASAPPAGEAAAWGLAGMFAAKSPAATNRSPSPTDAASSVSPIAPAAAHRDQTLQSTADPTANGPEQPNQFWLLVGSETTGPFRAAQIRAMFQSGELSPDARARRANTEEWVPLTEAVGALPPRLPAGAKTPPTGEAAAAVGAPSRQQKVDAPAPPATSPATPIEVRCGCGQLVYADERLADRNVQCPHCKASVAVPVATASSAPPAQPETPIEGAASVAGGVIGLVVLAACSDALPAGMVKILGFGAVVAIVGGLLVLFGGRRTDLFR